MRIVHVVPRISVEASGPSYSCVRLGRSLAELGHKITLLSASGSCINESNGFKHRAFPEAKLPPAVCHSPGLYKALKEEVKGSDIVHSHSLWLLPNVYPGWAAKRFNKPLVISPRGTFAPWAWKRSRAKKQLFWTFLQKDVVKQAQMFHATCQEEAWDLRNRGIHQPVCIVPNGIDIPDISTFNQDYDGPRQLLFLARIHPTKGLDILLNAWAEVQQKFPEWQLNVVGPDNVGYLAKMQDLAERKHLTRVNFIGPLFGNEKLSAYCRAELYVLPTHTENFGLTIAEALAAGTPAITTRGAPWAGLEQNQAGWWIDIGIDPLVACLEDALSRSPKDLAQMGHRGRDWMKRDFSWPNLAERMHAAYSWLLAGTEKPEYIQE